MGFIEEMDRGLREYNALPEAIRKDFDTLRWQFSPENLTCDGELSKTQVSKKLARLKREWKALEKKHNIRLNPAYLI